MDQCTSGLIFHFHFVNLPVLLCDLLITNFNFLLFFDVFIEIYILPEIIAMGCQYRMLGDISKINPFFSIYYKYLPEKIFHMLVHVLKLILLTKHICNFECWITLLLKFSFHVVTCNKLQNTFEWIFREKHEIEQNSYCPYIYCNSIVRVVDYLRSHVSLSTTVSLSSNTPDRPRKSKICNFILCWSATVFFRDLLEEHVFGFDISMNIFLLVNAFKSFQNFHQDLGCLGKRIDSSTHSSLMS